MQQQSFLTNMTGTLSPPFTVLKDLLKSSQQLTTGPYNEPV